MKTNYHTTKTKMKTPREICEEFQRKIKGFTLEKYLSDGLNCLKGVSVLESLSACQSCS